MGINKKQIIKALIVRKLRKSLKRKKRACDIRPIFFNRLESGESVLVRELSSDPFYHQRYFRMTKALFDEILEQIEPFVKTGKCHSRPISTIEKLAITLRFLATGNSQISMSLSYRISPPSIGLLLRETMEAICRVFEPECLPVPTKEKWRNIAIEFEDKWQFPNCCGAIDGKHIRIRAPRHSGSMNFNYKGYFSTVLMAIVDANYRFVLVDIGSSGSLSDGGVLARSDIGVALEKGTLNLPDDKEVAGEILPHLIVGDDAFPLRNNLLKPYPGKGLTTERRIYNYRLSRARMVSENAFGILAARWRILHTPINGEYEFVNLIVKTCVIIHNFLMSRKESSITADSNTNGEVVPGSWRNEVENCSVIDGIRPQGSNNYSITASSIRDKFMSYFNGDGALSWQNNMI